MQIMANTIKKIKENKENNYYGKNYIKEHKESDFRCL